jgi:benzoyl-CoA reductase/2-hydroxyglutaryl-CoA dehydratase subunit BcrC/BadD/HgdB
MIELLKTCGFEEHELETEMPRIEKAFQKLGITDVVIERGKQRLATYYDIELHGVRKAIGICIQDVVNTVLAREEGKKKILYGFMSGGFEVLGSALVSKSNDIHVTNMAATLQFVLGCIFDIMVPILEAAEQKWLKAGKAFHCGNVKTLVGLISLDLIPKPDLLVTSGQLCDTAPKTLDIIHEQFNIPTYYFDTCQDREFKEYPDSKRMLELSTRSIRELAMKTREITGFELSDDMVTDAINARNDLRQALRNIQNLMETADPLPVSTTHEMLWSSLGTLPWSMSELRKPATIVAGLYDELCDRVQSGKGIVEKGAPRILTLLPQHYMDPRWEHLLREVGIASVSSELGFFPLHGQRFIDFDEEKSQDPYRPLALLLHSSLAQSLSARTAIIIEACKRLHVDGVLDKYHVGCRINMGDALLIKNAIIKELGIPVLLMEWEGFDPRVYNEEQLRKRFELFRDTMLNSRKSHIDY